MTQGILLIAGGVGLFLLGMIVMTDGLKALAGSALRRVLTRFTRSPFSGAALGALTTAVVQSSSATTVSAVGFVGAGLLTFPEALGIVLGANVGTTATGWMAVLLGFKLRLGSVVLPLVLLGSAMRLFAPRRLGSVGMSLAGFGLVFVGIETLQHGMAAFEGLLTPASFPSNTWDGRLRLLLMGLGMTLLTQSSSSGVATLLAALHVGAMSLPQAAAMVVGMDMGTTVTAALATIGGSVQARRTGFAHVFYNLFAGSIAYFLVVPFCALWTTDGDGVVAEAGIALVTFHTFFNSLGLLIILPFAKTFARFMTRIFPGEVGATMRLDRALLREPELATDVALAACRDAARALRPALRELLLGTRRASDPLWSQWLTNVAEIHRYVGEIDTPARKGDVQQRQLAVLHATDHLDRLMDRAKEGERVLVLRQHAHTRRDVDTLVEALVDGEVDGDEGVWDADRLRSLADELAAHAEVFRSETLRDSAAGRITTSDAIALLDGHRWLCRLAYHCFRIAHHLTRPEQAVDAEHRKERG